MSAAGAESNLQSKSNKDALASSDPKPFHLRTIAKNFMMKHLYSVVAAVAFVTPAVWAAPTDDVYLLGPDSAPHEGVPKGKVIGPLTLASEVFTNTTRHYWIYVPAQYDAKKPASLMVFQDGHPSMCRGYEACRLHPVTLLSPILNRAMSSG